jgi:hypothetical protein
MRCIIKNSKGNDSAYRHLIDDINDKYYQLYKSTYQSYIEQDRYDAGLIDLKNEIFLRENNFISDEKIYEVSDEVAWDIWVHNDKMIRVTIPNRFITNIDEFAQLIEYALANKETILRYKCDLYQTLYLTFLLPDHRALFEYYNVLIEENGN